MTCAECFLWIIWTSSKTANSSVPYACGHSHLLDNVRRDLLTWKFIKVVENTIWDLNASTLE